MQKTKIEYLTHTWNPIAMCCTPVSEGCTNCWHIRMANRMASMPWPDTRGLAYNPGRAPMLNEKELSAPQFLKKPARIGVQFMGDLFHPNIPDNFIVEVFAVIGQATQHTFMILTKRPARLNSFFVNMLKLQEQASEKNDRWSAASLNYFCNLKNLWLGVSVEDQKTADERIPLLLQTPAAHRFVSYEPALGPVDFCSVDGKIAQSMPEHPLYPAEMIDWIIMGGETGPGARPMHPDWAMKTRDDCQATGVPFFFKQWGTYKGSGDYNIPAGCLIDGKEYKEIPINMEAEC